jgi:hypothetical protein
MNGNFHFGILSPQRMRRCTFTFRAEYQNHTSHWLVCNTGDTAVILANRYDVSGLCGSQMRFGFLPQLPA